MCKYYEVPMEIFATKEELGHWIGKAYRASICILDEGFAKSIVKNKSEYGGIVYAKNEST